MAKPGHPAHPHGEDKVKDEGHPAHPLGKEKKTKIEKTEKDIEVGGADDEPEADPVIE